MNNGFQNKTVLITGASRGLGLKIAEEFWQQGANLKLVARSEAALENARLYFKNSSHKNQHIEVIISDLSDTHAVSKLIKNLEQEQIDILVNNAAIQGPIGPVWENDWQAWLVTLQVNLLAPISLCRAFIPKMIQRNYGKIINISGGGATGSRPNFTAYAVAKAALVRFSETLSDEVKGLNINVNCIAPGLMNTAMLTEILEADAKKVGHEYNIVKEKKLTLNDANMNRAAELCVFLASQNCEEISGKLISAVWDPWKKIAEYAGELKDSDIYTLRRIIPNDRGKDWSTNA